MIGRLCDWCAERPADPRYREIVGIEERRRSGGANRIIGRRPTGRMPCRECVELARRRLSHEQATLW